MVVNKAQSANLSAAGRDSFDTSPLQEGILIERSLTDPTFRGSITAPEPRKSFFRGVAVGVGIMIPVWVWLFLRFIL